MKKKIRQRPYITGAISILMVGMLALSLILPDKAFSSTENRSLATSANFNLNALNSGKTGQDLNNWFSDQFPGRTLFFHADYLIRKMTGQKEIKSVFLGKGALLADPEAEKEGNVSDTVQAINDFGTHSSLPCFVMVSPSAASIQTDKLPFDANVRDVNPMLDSIYSSLNGPTGVDLRQTLKDHAAEYIFYKTDHHWTTLGAGLAAQQLLATMGIEMNPDDFDLMQVSNDFEGTLASKTGSVFLKDKIDIAVSKNNPGYIVTWADGTRTSSIYDQNALKTKDQYQVFLSANQSRVQIDTESTSNRTLLLFKDSYANSIIQYLLPYFSSITIVDPRYYYDDLELTLGSDLFTDCAFIYSADTFATVSSLHDVLASWNAQHQELTETQQTDAPAVDPAEDQAEDQGESQVEDQGDGQAEEPVQ